MINKSKKVIQIIGYKNSGKTTLVCQLIHQLKSLGYAIASIKHDAHDFEVDYPGKDTWKFREAGADVVAITSKDKTAIMSQRAYTLDDMITNIEHTDFILVEGFKQEKYPKIVLIKHEDSLELIKHTANILAIVIWDEFINTEDVRLAPFRHKTMTIHEIDRLVKVILEVN